MKGCFVLVLLVTASVSLSDVGYQPIAGDLLHHWNTSSPTCFPWVRSFDTGGLDGVSKVCITGIEVERDSLDLYLFGVTSSTEVPLLLATGGYRGEFNFAKSYAIYENDEFCLSFQMPFSARYSEGYYRWDADSNSLVLTRYVTGDPSVESIETVDSLLAEGEIAEAIFVLNNMFYPDNYYNREEMIVRLLRSANRVALQAGEISDFQKAAEVFQSLSSFLCGAGGSYPIFNDSLDFFSSEFYSYMELDEFVMIMNNHAFFLEKTGVLDESLAILRNVLVLDSFRTVAYLNIADVLWAAGDRAEAVEHYTTYLWMMSDNGLYDQIPARVHERTLLEIVSSSGSSAISVLSEISYSIEMQSYDPARIDSCLFLSSGGIRVLLSRYSLSTSFGSFDDNLWAVDIDSNGNLVSFEEVLRDNRTVLGFPQFGESEDLMLVACTELGDTLWTCTFEGQPLEWFHSPDVSVMSEGYIVNDSPDCFATTTYIHRVSNDGDVLFNSSLDTQFLLDKQDMEGEIYPGVNSFRETVSGDILVGGSVSLWLNSPKAGFVCLLDGETGDVLWKMTHFGLGSARVHDVIETSSGSIVAVGVSGRHLWPPDPKTGLWGATRPFIAVLNGVGELQQLIVCDLEHTGKFISIAEWGPMENQFLIACVNTASSELVLLKTVIQVDL